MQQNSRHHLFVAVPLPDEVKRSLAGQAEQLRSQWPFQKWVHASDYHITLHFLGGCDPDLLGTISKSLAKSVIDQNSFTLTVQGLGFFGRAKQPRILWAGVSGEAEALHQLQLRVVDHLAPLGFTREKRPYCPHITLAKRYKKQDFPSKHMAFQWSDEAQLTWVVKRIVLYQTHLGKAPMYEALHTYDFAAKQ